MKKLISFLILVAGFWQLGMSQENDKTSEIVKSDAASVEWETKTIDFGKIKRHVPAKAEFKVKNTGNVAIIINEVRPTCGCTVAKYTKEAIKPGETGTIEATYNAAALGAFNKSITVTLSFQTNKEILRLKGEVVENL